MNHSAQPIDAVSYSEFLAHPVWEFISEPEPHQDETWVYPVPVLPVHSLANRLVASSIHLANGQTELAFLGNVDLKNPTNMAHFLTVSIVRPTGERFHLARYFDIGYSESGPGGLAEFLALPTEQVFPLQFDITAVAVGHAQSLRGTVPLEPTVRLSRAQRIALALR